VLDVRFIVEGKPIPKGNHAAYPISRGRCEDCKPGRSCGRKNCFGGVIVGTVITDDGGKELEAWEQLVHVQAISARNRAAQRLVEPPASVEVRMIFVLPRPGGHWTESGSGQLTAAGRERRHPSVKPDWDKLARAVADGLTGALVRDDSQIVIGQPAKVYAPYRGKAGVIVVARQLGDELPEWIAAELVTFGIVSAGGSRQGMLL
jgi:Holliday junction resolvase RusA-like endonuclease